MSDPPAVFNGRYELRNQIARGGTAQVYLARDLLLDRPVALKVLMRELSTDHSFVERFRREAQAAANLSHPNIVPVFDWGEADHTYFIVMEYVDGEPLSSIIRTQAPIDPHQTASIGADIAKALSYAHRHGVVHRDVKPGNVLITADGLVKVTDFGIARAIGGGDEQVTQTGLVMGTATYFSPEQAQGLEVDGRSDVYSLGVVCYEMATGKTPFSGDTPVAIAYQHVREQPPMPREVNPAVPAALEAIILESMAKLPAERYPTAEDLRADLDRFVRGQTVLARIPSDVASGPVTTVISRTPGNGDTTAVGTVEDWEQRAPSTTKWWLSGGAVAAVVLGLLIFFGGRALGYFGAGPGFAVPNVVGMKQFDAEQKLLSKGLHWTIQNVQGNTSNTGKVTVQDPSSGLIRSGGTVKLTVAGAPPKTTVPPVTNLTVDAAKSQLQGQGFQVQEKGVPANDPSQTQGLVIDQSPPANSSVNQGSTVTITYVKGSSLKTVPDFTNVDQLKAGSLITAAGLTVGSTTTQFSSTVPDNQIISSSPASGTQVPAGTAVNLVISQGQGVVVQSLVGDTEAQATATLQQQGLVAVVGPPKNTDSAGLIGNVASQKPKAGTEVAPGSTVTIRIGQCGDATCQSTSTTTTLPPGGVPSSSLP